MRKSIFIVAVLFAMLCSFNAKAQSTPEEIMTPFFKLLEQDVDKALDHLFATNEWLVANKEVTGELKNKFESTRKLLGNFNGYELVGKYYLGQSYAKYVYVLKYERQPLEFVVTMYKPDKTWRLQNINFHSDFEKDMVKIED